jgi:DNA-binding beta-propeller fold protein YncE
MMDKNNARILVFPLTTGNLIASKTPANAIGQSDFISCSTPAVFGPASIGTWSTYTGGGMAFDAVNNRLFVADTVYNRVLVFSTSTITNDMNASYVLGQPNFTPATSAATTQSGLNQPTDVAFDSTNELLYVGDSANNRVMVFNVAPGTIANGENASYVLGQSSFTSNTAATTQSGLTASTTYAEITLALDLADQLLYVGDGGNARVMVFNVAPGTIANGENASYVLGQSSFTSNTEAVTQSGLSAPLGLAYDAANSRLFVTDSYIGSHTGNRVLVFSTSSLSSGENASYVLGQANFTTGTGHTTQSGLYEPSIPIFDSTNDLLYVCDGAQTNNRVMVFNVAPGTIANGENASDLLGEYTSLTSTATVIYTQNGQNNGPTALGFNLNSQHHEDTVIDPVDHYLFANDNGNNRVMAYTLKIDNSFPTTSGGHTASFVLGQSSLEGANAPARTQSGLDNPYGLAFDPVNQRLFIADTTNCRVMVFGTSSLSNGENASYVLGASNFTAFSCSATQSTLYYPMAVALDAVNQLLYVADNHNGRVMVFNVAPGTIANGENASYVLGQPDFTTTTAATTQSEISDPEALGFDAVNRRLFVADRSNSRVMVFNVAPATIANGENASYVLGQPNFTTAATGTGPAQMNAPISLAYDAANSRLFVGEYSNLRVTVFMVPPTAIATGMSYSLAFIPTGGSTGQSGVRYPVGLLYDPGSSRLFIYDLQGGNRIMIFDGSYLPPTTPGYD